MAYLFRNLVDGDEILLVEDAVSKGISKAPGGGEGEVERRRSQPTVKF